MDAIVDGNRRFESQLKLLTELCCLVYWPKPPQSGMKDSLMVVCTRMQLSFGELNAFKQQQSRPTENLENCACLILPASTLQVRKTPQNLVRVSWTHHNTPGAKHRPLKHLWSPMEIGDAKPKSLCFIKASPRRREQRHRRGTLCQTIREFFAAPQNGSNKGSELRSLLLISLTIHDRKKRLPRLEI